MEATTIVHWVSGPVLACDKHADQLAKLGAFLGIDVATSPCNGGVCSNCVNESKSK
jgi:hypothetical protein